MVYWSAPISAFDHYRISYRAAEGKRPHHSCSCPKLTAPALPPSAGPIRPLGHPHTGSTSVPWTLALWMMLERPGQQSAGHTGVHLQAQTPVTSSVLWNCPPLPSPS